MSLGKNLAGKGLALALVMLVALSGVPGLFLLGSGAAVTLADEGREDAAKLLVYSRMISRGLETLGLSDSGAEQVAAALGISVGEAEELIRIAGMSPQEIFSLDAETVAVLKEKAEYYYDIMLSVIEQGIDRDELKKAIDRALLQRIADVVGRIGESLNDTVIIQAAEQVRNATSMEEARRQLAQVVERLQALNIYMLSETLDDALLRSLERLVDEADMGYLEDSIEKMREEIAEVRELASRYGTVFAEDVDPEVESRLSLALEKISEVETTLESMGTVTETIVNATGAATGVVVDPAKVVEAGVKARISLLQEKLNQIEAQLRSMLETGMADPQWAAQAMELSDRVRQHLANATASLAEGDFETAFEQVSKADELLTRLAFEVRYKSVEMQALVQARLAAARALLTQVETRINETQAMIERLYDTANATGAQATLSTLEQARTHLQNAVQLAEQARTLLQANDTRALDILNQALQEVIQAKAMANAARSSLTIELQVLVQVTPSNGTQVTGNATIAANETIVGNGTQVNVTSPAPNATASAPNQTQANATQPVDTASQVQARVETRLAYAKQLMAQAMQVGSESAYEYAFKASELLQIALNLSSAGDVEGAKRLVDQADYYIIKAEMELAEHGLETRPEGVDYRLWEVKKDIVEVEYELKLVLARMEAANISDPLATELAAKALELLNQSKTLLDQGDLIGAIDALYKAEDLASYVEDLVESWFEEEELGEYLAGPQARITEVEYLINKALAKIEQARAQPGFANSTAAQTLVEQALQMIEEAKLRLQEAVELMNQGQDYTLSLRLATSLAEGAIELADQAIDLAERAWEQAIEEEEKRFERTEELIDKVTDLRETAAELRTRISEIRATGAYDEQLLNEAEQLISEAEEIITQAEQAVAAGENAQPLISQARALLERASILVDAAEKTEAPPAETETETRAPEEEVEETPTQTQTQTVTEVQEHEARIDRIEDKAYRILDRLETLASAGVIDEATASEVRSLVDQALAQVEAARTALDVGADARPYIETAEDLLSKAEDLLEQRRNTETTTETRVGEEETRTGRERGGEYEEKAVELRNKAFEIQAKASTLLEAGVIDQTAYDTVQNLVSEALTLIDEALAPNTTTVARETLLAQASSLIEQAEYTLETAAEQETTATTTPSTETTVDTSTEESEETQSPTESSEQTETTANTTIITTTTATTTSFDEDLANEVQDKIEDAQDKASDLRERAFELQANAEEEGDTQALSLINEALSLIETATTTLNEAQALLSVGDVATAESLVNTAASYLNQADSLLEEAEGLLD